MEFINLYAYSCLPESAILILLRLVYFRFIIQRERERESERARERESERARERESERREVILELTTRPEYLLLLYGNTGVLVK